MFSINRDVIALIRIFTSCLTAGFLIFFVSSLSGEDLIKNNSTIEDLDNILGEITVELEDGIDRRISQRIGSIGIGFETVLADGLLPLLLRCDEPLFSLEMPDRLSG